MRGLTHRWERRPGAAEAVPAYAGMEPLAARILAARGLCDAAGAASFCDPKMSELHNPSLLAGCDAAAARILEAVRAGARVAIYGDYDVDGVCAAAILCRMARAIVPGADLLTYIPHRVDEGYGLNVEAIRGLAAQGARLIVSVDCGITAIEPAAVARSLGVELIITDHHTFGPALPEAAGLVHPRLAGADGKASPFGDLCGAGVAFKIAWRMATLAHGGERVSEEMRIVLLDLLALAALGVIADVVPLVGENRVIARHGLARMKSTGIIGLRALIDASGLGGERVDAEHVGFRLAPRLNAAGRMGHARDALELMLAGEGEASRAMEIARALAKQNEERRATERAIAERAAEMACEAGMTGEDRRAVALAREGWHAGVLGIACSRLVEKFCRPVILLARENGECHGSGRSIDGFDLHAALTECADCLERFGGHEMAAGLTLRSERLEEFTERFTRVANERISPEELTPRMRYDCEVALGELTVRGVEQAGRLGPFGRGNETPVVLVRGLRLMGGARPMGANGAHLEMHASKDGKTLRMIAWGWGERRGKIAAGAEFDALVEPKVSAWSGRVVVEPVVRDLAICGAG